MFLKKMLINTLNKINNIYYNISSIPDLEIKNIDSVSLCKFNPETTKQRLLQDLPTVFVFGTNGFVSLSWMSPGIPADYWWKGVKYVTRKNPNQPNCIFKNINKYIYEIREGTADKPTVVMTASEDYFDINYQFENIEQ